MTLRLKPDGSLGLGGVAGTALLRPERVLVVASPVDQEVRVLQPKGTSDSLDQWLGREPRVHTGIIGIALKIPGACLHS